MKHGCEHTQKDHKSSKYVSCIKINGIPILPPLITPEKRKEARRYRREALKIEKRLKRDRELKDYISELYQTCSHEFDEGLNTTIESLVEHVGSSLPNEAFYEQIAHDILKETHESECQFPEYQLLPLDVKLKTQRKLSCSVQATQYVNNEFTTILESPKSPEVVLLETFENQDLPKTPKLVRSNSYVLEAPSPALIEYLKSQNLKHDQNEGPLICWGSEIKTTLESISLKENKDKELKDDCDNISEFLNNQNFETPHSSFVVTDLNELAMIQQTYESINNGDLQITSVTPKPEQKKSNCTIDTKSDVDEYYDIYDIDLDTSRTETELKSICDSETNIPITENLHDFISNDMPESQNQNDEANISITSEKSELSLNSDLNCILKKIPAEYSRQILQILEKQNLANYMNDRFDDIRMHPEKYSTPHETGIGDTIYYSVNDGNENQEHDQSLPVQNIENLRSQEAQTPEMRRNRAATVLCAATKGFLVRRLMKTDKVQNLIQTIKDALIFALQLHNDTLEHIEEADVELHRRLIQQVSAACYAFHDVFFATSIQDKMSFIAVDRQLKRDKMRRLLSANSNVSNKSSSRTKTPNSGKKTRKISIRL